MKKIISLFASISMLVASMAFAPVASAADAPTLEVEATKITDFTNYPDYDYGEGYEAYLVKFNLTGVEIAATVGTSGMGKGKTTGTALASYSVQYEAEINGDKDDAWVFDTLSAIGAEQINTWNGKKHTFTYGSNTAMTYPLAGEEATITKDDSITLLTAILVMAEGESFAMAMNDVSTKAVISNFKNNGFQAGTNTEYVLKVSNVTIPMAEGGEDDDDNTAEAMADGVLVASGLHAGKTSATTSVYAGASVTSIKVKDSDGKEQTASLPTLLGQGYANIMTVILYNANEMAGKTFNVEYFAGEDVVKTYTYKVPSSN